MAPRPWLGAWARSARLPRRAQPPPLGCAHGRVQLPLLCSAHRRAWSPPLGPSGRQAQPPPPWLGPWGARPLLSCSVRGTRPRCHRRARGKPSRRRMAWRDAGGALPDVTCPTAMAEATNELSATWQVGRRKKAEANYLKLCGTITETPAELQNESCEINLENANECNNMPTNAPATNCTFLSEANSSEGCTNEEQYILSPDLNIDDTQDLQGVESVPHAAFLEKTPFLNSKHTLLDRSVSTFPTPSVLKDNMETPGTIYTSHRGAPVSGKRVRTRKQFIYPVLRPIENKLHHMELIEDTSAFPLPNPLKGRNLGADSIKKPKQTSSTSVAKPGFPKSPPFSSPDGNASYQEKEAQYKCQIGNVERLDEGALSKSNSDEKHAALSLSHWLRPSSTDNENQGDVKCAAGDQSNDEGSLLTERPVFVALDLNWDVENPTPRFPKTWDGNGIPNTNTRYKEDKKVTWHATPFEERLLKVLSDEEVRPARVARGKLFHPEEKAE